MSYSVIAARKALPQLNINEWAVMGHSEGGLAAWLTAEREVRQPSGGYLGGVALAPGMNVVDILRTVFDTSEGRQAAQEQGTTFYLVYVLAAISRLYPTLNPADYLTTAGAQFLNLTLSGGCFQASATFAPELTFDDIWQNYTWIDSTEAQEWTRLTGANGLGRIDKPLLIAQGTADEAVAPSVVRETFDTYCESFGKESPISYSLYPGFKHTPLVDASVQEWSRFLNELFEGKKPSNFAKCETVMRNASFGTVNYVENYYSAYSAPVAGQTS